MRNGFMMTMMSLLAVTTTVAAATPRSDVKRVAAAAAVITELRAAPDKGVPEHIWNRARCVVVMPGVKKAAFVVGGEFGEGIVSCRTTHGWSGPVFMSLHKGSIGAQIGAESTDLVLLIMNDRGIDRLLQDKVTLGGEASVAAGPVGRSSTAETDLQLTAEMLSYSRARGLFAGVDLSGGVMRLDHDASRRFYHHQVADRELLTGTSAPRIPAAATPLIAALGR